MAVAFVQSAVANISSLWETDNSVDSTNLSSLPTIGNTVIAASVAKSSNSSYVTISDSYGNTYTHQRVSFTVVSTDYYATIAYSTVQYLPSSGFHITASFDGSGTGLIAAYIAEFSGVGTTDGTMLSSNYGYGTSISPSNLTVPSGNLTVALFNTDDSTSSETITTPSGWTKIDNITSFKGVISELIYNINASSPANPTWTIGTSCNWVGTQHTFNPGTSTTLGIDALLMFHL